MGTPGDGADIGKRLHRGLAWLASSMVGLLDILAMGRMVVFWIPKEDVGVGTVPTMNDMVAMTSGFHPCRTNRPQLLPPVAGYSDTEYEPSGTSAD